MTTRQLPTLLLLLLPFFAAGREPNAEALARSNAKPLAFIENKGQIVDQNGNHRNDIDAKLEAKGLTVFVGDGAIHYQWTRVTDASGHPPSSPFKGGVSPLNSNFSDPISNIQHPISNIDIYRMDVELVGANKNAIAVYGAKQEYFENYYLAQCPDGATAYSFNKITYKNVYPGIDWVLYSKGNELKYDFIVHTGGDVKNIKLRYSGATSVYLKEGALIAETPFGSITEQKPYSYDAATKQELPSGFTLNDNELSFDVAASGARSLVIDPSLEWATYYGGLGEDLGSSVTLDTVGNVYMAGRTASTGNISTLGAHQTTISTDKDGMLVKFNSAGVRQWGTYYGGSGYDLLSSLAYHISGFIYTAGETTSHTGIATAGAHQQNISDTFQADLFLAKFNLSGARQWATYYGGDDFERYASVACDKPGNVYLAGTTESDTGISTPGSAQPLMSGGHLPAGSENGLLVKFSPTGTRLWGTYYGNWYYNECYSVACDTYGNVYTGGMAHDSTPTTPGSFQPSSGGWDDGTLVKYNSNGVLLWATHYGGSGDDFIFAVACQGPNVFIGGRTNSLNLPVSPGAFQTSGTGQNGFLARFDSSGSRYWGTYFASQTNSLAIGPANNLYIKGATSVNSGFATPGSWQSSYGGGNTDLFFSEFTFNGARRWTSYYGSSGDESYSWSNSTVYDFKNDRIYFAGTTSSTSGVATSGSHQSSFGGYSDALLVKFRPDTLVSITGLVDTLLCIGDSLKVIYKCVHGFYPTNVFTVQLSDANGSFANPVAIGSLASGGSDTIDCAIPMNTPTGNGYRVRIVANGPAFVSDNNGANMRIINLTSTTASSNSPVCSGTTLNLATTGTTGAGYSWSGPVSYSSGVQNPVISNASTAQSGDYVVTATLSVCSFKDTIAVTVKPTPTTPVATSNSPVCAGGVLNLFATTTPAGASYKWNGPNGFASTMQNPVITPATMADAGIYDVQAELNGCTSAAGMTTVVVNTVSSLVIYPSPNDTICIGSNVTFVSVPQNAGTSPQYQWYKNGAAIPGATANTYSTTTLTSGDSVYCVMTVTGVCSDPLAIASSKIGVTVLPLAPPPTVSITANPGLLLSPWQLVQFTAVATGAGALPKYQWKRNSQDVIGATGDTWSANNLWNGDTISCVVTSSVWCATPASAASNKMVVNIKTGITDIERGSGLQLYPNPNNGSFVVYLPLTTSRGGHVSVDVVNAVGQRVYSNSDLQITNHQLEIALPVSVANGVYMLKLQSEDGIETIRFTVAR